MKRTFTQEDTKIIKGVAILLMIMHHLWAFPDRIVGGSLKVLFSKALIKILGNFGNICVPLFFFLGGYGMYITSKKKKIDIINKLKKIYISYWKVFLIFIPIAFLFFRNQIAYCKDEMIYSRFNDFNIYILLQNFLGIDTSYNGEWWFLTSYIVAIISFPLIKYIFDKNKAVINYTLIIIFSILFTNVFPAIGNIDEIGHLNDNYLYKLLFCQISPYIASFWMGIVAAKENLLMKLKKSMKDNNMLNITFDILIIITIIFLRQISLGWVFDIIYIPFFIVSIIDLLSKIPFIRNIILKIGNQSTNMWLIHSFYCYYFYPIAKMVVALKYALPCLLVLIFITYISSLLVDWIWNKISKISKFLIERYNLHFS